MTDEPKRKTRPQSPEQRARIAESNSNRMRRARARKDAIDKLQEEVFSGGNVDAAALRKIAIGDALEQLRSDDPHVRKQGQDALDDLCPVTDREPPRHSNMTPRN